MKVSCPNCHLKGLLDDESPATETRIFCVQCGVAYDVVLFDGRVETFLLPNPPASSLKQTLTPTQDVTPMTIDAKHVSARIESDNILSIPATPYLNYDMSTQAPILEDVFLNSPADSTTHAFAEVVEYQAAPESSPALAERQQLASSKETFETPQSAFAPTVETNAAQVSRAKENLSSRQDNYSLGVQLLRVSPAWLLAGGLVFVSFIVLCNWLIKPTAHADELQASPAALNQAASKSTVSSKTAMSLSTTSSRAANANSNQSVALPPATVSTESKENSKPAVEASSAPVAETKTAPVVAAAAPVEQTPAQKGGGLTLQVGSYNEMAQANERVASLKAAGFEARAVSVEIPKRGTWYRVQVGRFADRAEAVRFGEQMRGKGAAENVIVTEVQK